MTLNNLYEILNKLFPFDTAEEWDKVGFFNKNFIEKIDNVLICLDINCEIVNYAISNNIKFIISHHPIYIDEHDIKKSHIKKIIKLIYENNITILSVHTNFDKSKYGMNKTILKKIGLTKINKLNSSDYLYFGKLLNEINISSFLEKLLDKLEIDFLTYDNNDFRIANNKKISTIAICAGAGSSELLSIKKKDKIDVFITGEVKWHLWEEAKQKRITIIDVGHIIEKHFTSVIKKILDELNINSTTLNPTIQPRILMHKN